MVWTSCPSVKNTAISRTRTRGSSIPRLTEPSYQRVPAPNNHPGSHASGPTLTIIHSCRTPRQKGIVLYTASPTCRATSPNVKLDDRFAYHQQAAPLICGITAHSSPCHSSTKLLADQSTDCSALCPSLPRADVAPGAWLMSSALMSSGLRHHA